MNSLRKKPVSELVALFQIRELAKSDAERVALTAIIAEMFDSVGHPLVQVKKATRAPSQDLGQPDDSEPWIWYVEQLLADIASGAYKHPYKFDHEDDCPILCVRTGHWMEHVRQAVGGAVFSGLPIQSDRLLKKRLKKAAVLILESDGNVLTFERTIQGRRVGHMVALSLLALTERGIAVPTRDGD